MALFPHDLTKLLTGPIRLGYAPVATAKPTNIADFMGMVAPYDWVGAGNWKGLGAVPEGEESEYSRELDSEELRIEQSTAAVLKKITESNRSWTTPLAEWAKDEILKIAEEGVGPTTIAAAANKGAQKAVDVGSVESLTRYRFVAVAQRDPAFGATVTEPGGAVRGPFVAFAAYQASVQADEAAVAIQRGELSALELGFEFFPDSSIADPRIAVGRWFIEEPGVIA